MSNSSISAQINRLRNLNYGRSIRIITSETVNSFLRERRFILAVLYYVVIPLFLVFIESTVPVIQSGTGIAIYQAQIQTTAYIKSFFLSFFPGQLFLVILSADLIAGEVEAETFPLLYSKPVYGSEIILGKYFGSIGILAILQVPTLLVIYIVFMVKYKAETLQAYLFSFDELVFMLLIVLLLQGIILAISILLSTLFNKSLYAILGLLLSLFLISTISDGMASDPESINYLSPPALIDAVLPHVFFNLDPIDNQIGLIPFFIGCLVVISGILTVSTIILNRKEIY